MTTAAIYARVSSEQQRNNNSIDHQLRTCREYATRQGFTVTPDHEFVDVFTGTKLDRPGFDQAKQVVGKVDAIIFHVQDRFGRADALDTVQQIRWFEKCGTKVHITNRGEIDTTDDIGLIILLLEVQAAKKELARIVRRMSDGRYDRAAKGKPWCGKAMNYGYDYDKEKGEIVLNPAESPWVVKIYEWHAIERLGLLAIAHRLQELGVPTKFDNLSYAKPFSTRCRWSQGSVNKVLTAPIYYTGVWTYGKTNKDGRPRPTVKVPAIVSKELWDAAQQASKENQKCLNKGGQKFPALFRGRMTCSCCNRRFAQEGDHRYGTHYYSCLGQKKYFSADGKSKPCTGGFDQIAVDNAVWDALANELKHPERTIEGFKQRTAQREAELQPDRDYLARLQSELAKLDARWQRLKKLYLDGDYAKEDLDVDKVEIDNERQIRLDKIAELQARLSAATVDDLSIEAFEHYCARICRGIDVLNFEEKRRLIDALNIRLTVHRAETCRKGHRLHGTGRVTLTASVPLDIEIELNSDAANLSPST